MPMMLDTYTRRYLVVLAVKTKLLHPSGRRLHSSSINKEYIIVSKDKSNHDK